MKYIKLFEKFNKYQEQVTAEQIAQLLSLSITSVLGEGTAGYAYMLSDGRVLKITGDRTEAILAEMLIDKNFEHIAPHYDVTEVRVNNETLCYAIIKAYVEPIEQHPNYKQIGSTLSHINFSRKKIRGFTKNPLVVYDLYKDPTEPFYQMEISQEMLEVWKSIIFDIRSLGVSSYDIYPENCGIYAGKIVVFDLGYVKGTNKKNVTKIIDM
jgi:hypothetical protein